MYTTLLDQSGGAKRVRTINGSRDGRANEHAQKFSFYEAHDRQMIYATKCPKDLEFQAI